MLVSSLLPTFPSASLLLLSSRRVLPCWAPLPPPPAGMTSPFRHQRGFSSRFLFKAIFSDESRGRLFCPPFCWFFCCGEGHKLNTPAKQQKNGFLSVRSHVGSCPCLTVRSGDPSQLKQQLLMNEILQEVKNTTPEPVEGPNVNQCRCRIFINSFD